MLLINMGHHSYYLIAIWLLGNKRDNRSVAISYKIDNRSVAIGDKIYNRSVML